MKHLFTILLIFSLGVGFCSAQWSSNGSKVYYNGGYVGIGTSNPAVKLHLYSSNTSIGADIDTRRLNGSANLRLRNDVQMWALNVRGDLGDRFTIRDKGNNNKSVDVFQLEKNAPSKSFYMKWDGKIGFGTTPDERLHIKSIYKKALIKLENSFFSSRGDGGWKIGVDDDVFFIKDHNNNGIFQIKEDLTITMGISNRTTEILGKLCVKPTPGTSCPDYVFEDDYELRSLEELKEYIRKNKHLPGVKSAAEIEADGSIEYVQMSYSMLEKIEELTLYTLEQEEKLALLLKRIQTLEEDK